MTGFDLTTRSHQEEVVKHVKAHKPLVLALGVPCASFGHWAHLSQMLHRATWRQSREIGERLAQVVAKFCKLQTKARRHFLLENVVGFGIFGLLCPREL